MKNFYVTFILVFVFQFALGQIVFSDRYIEDPINSVNSHNSLFTGDIDGDGDMDIIVASGSSNKIIWYEKTSLGFYDPHTISDNAEGAKAVYVKDIDNDGDLDVLSASSNDNKIAWYENLDGNGLFSNELIISLNADGASSVFSIDIDNDGDMDVLSASSNDDKVAWYENLDGNGLFGSEQIVTTNSHGAFFVSAADIDNDGDVDVFSGSSDDDEIVWYENIDGQGDFGVMQIIASSINGLRSVHIADIDGDSDIDVLAVAFDGDSIVWYENMNGLGSFSSELYIGYTNAPLSVYTGDIDADGDLDVVVGSISSSASASKLNWFENTDGQGTFGSFQQIDVDVKNSIGIVHCADLDADGDVDILSSPDSGLSWHNNLDGIGGFNPENISFRFNKPQSVFSEDIDGDGDMDILMATELNDKISWLENIDGLGTFRAQKTITSNADGALSVYAVDIDGDNDIDVLSASKNDDKIAWYENINGLGDFGAQQIITTNANGAQSVYAADIDGDGDMDVLSASPLDNTVAWYENTDGQGAFGNEQVVMINDLYVDVKSVDIDGDLDLDIVSLSFNTGGIRWVENLDGLGTFGNQQSISGSADETRSFSLADFNGDSFIDILIGDDSSSNARIRWLENDGAGNFIHKTLNSSYGAEVLTSADLDGDGDIDIITGDKGWYENIDGLGNFSTSMPFTDDDNYNIESWVSISDLDGDGDLDVLTASVSDNQVVWHKNLGNLGNEINGQVQLDLDSNGCTNDDIVGNNLMITSNNGSDSFSTFSQLNGSFQIAVNEGDFLTSISNLSNYYQSNPIFYDSNFIGLGNIDTVSFCLEPAGTFNDLNIAVYPSINDPRPGFDTSYQIVYNNVGTTQLSGSVSFEFDDSKLQLLTASETITSQTVNMLNFDFADLNPFETRTIDLQFNVFTPPATNIDDILMSAVIVNPISGDETEGDNTYILEQTVIGSYDPNDIRVLEGEQILIEDADKYLHYVIRFQNTGTASAINVRVDNVLDDKLDWTTMQLESLSHDGRVEVLNGSEVSFIFNNIDLADSTSDEPNSHGFIAYKIKPKNDVVLGDVFFNTADIFFDFNPPITTNTVSTEIVDALSVEEFESNLFSVYPNPTTSTLTVNSKFGFESLRIIDVNGRILNTVSNKNSELSKTINVEDLANGIYFLNIKARSTEQTMKFIKN